MVNQVSQLNNEVYYPVEKEQPKENKCTAGAKKIGNLIKNGFSKYFGMWAEMFGSIKGAWKISKSLGVFQAMAISMLALAHIIAVASLIAGAVLIGMGTGGAGLLAAGIVATPFVFGYTAYKFLK